MSTTVEWSDLDFYEQRMLVMVDRGQVPRSRSYASHRRARRRLEGLGLVELVDRDWTTTPRGHAVALERPVLDPPETPKPPRQRGPSPETGR